MPTTTVSVLTDAQKRTVDAIYRTFEGWTTEQESAATELSNANYDRLRPIVKRVEAQCSQGVSDRVSELTEKHGLTDEQDDALTDEAYEYQIKGGCGPLVGDAILAVVARPWISNGDYRALIQGWDTEFGPVPS